MDVQALLEFLPAWAVAQPGLAAVLLVGSRARGAARQDSDLDLVFLLDSPKTCLEDQDWIGAFGTPLRVNIEHWGDVTSLRVFYRDGSQVEFALAGIDWGADPGDAGSATVIRNGARVIYDRGINMAARLEAHLDR